MSRLPVQIEKPQEPQDENDTSDFFSVVSTKKETPRRDTGRGHKTLKLDLIAELSAPDLKVSE